MNYISFGGWCGTMISLKMHNLFNEPSLPFDGVKSSIEGIIDCIENNFINFFPKEIKIDDKRNFGVDAFIGEYIGFYNTKHNLFDKNCIESFERKIARFDEKVKKGDCVFLRTIIRENYEDEIKHYKRLQDVIDKKYPNISYIVCYIIQDQSTTQYYKNLDNRTFLFTLHSSCNNYHNEFQEYLHIYNYIQTTNLFINIPEPNNIEKITNSNRLWSINGYPSVDYVEKNDEPAY
jgi:hypothetical protein